MSFASRNFIPFMLRSTTAGSVSEATAGGYRALDEQSLFPNDDDKDISMIGFKRVKTFSALWIQLVSSIALTVTGLFYAYYGCYSGNECSGYYTMLYLRAVFWVITYIYHIFIKSRHDRLKLCGYHKFLRLTHTYKKVPLKIVSASNLLILTGHTVLLQIFGSKFFLDCSAKRFSATLAISVFCLIECAILILIHISYYVKVRIFNIIRSPPDAISSTEHRRAGHHCMSPEEFINQQFLMIVKLMDDNRHLQDKIKEARSSNHLINSESTHLSMAEQSMIGY